MKGSSAAAEIEAAGPELRALAGAAAVVVCEVPGASATTVVRVVAGPGRR